MPCPPIVYDMNPSPFFAPSSEKTKSSSQKEEHLKSDEAKAPAPALLPSKL